LKRLNQEYAIGAVCFVLSGAILLITRTFPSKTTGGSDLTGPSFYPNLLAGIFMFCGACEFIQGFRNKEDRNPISFTYLWAGIRRPGPLNIVVIIGLILFFILFMETLGFVPCSYLVAFVLMWRLGVPVLRNVFYSVCFVILLVVIFGKVFTIYLPSGILDSIGL